MNSEKIELDNRTHHYPDPGDKVKAYWMLGNQAMPFLVSMTQLELANRSGVAQVTISRAATIRERFGSPAEASGARNARRTLTLVEFVKWCNEMLEKDRSERSDKHQSRTSPADRVRAALEELDTAAAINVLRSECRRYGYRLTSTG